VLYNLDFSTGGCVKVCQHGSRSLSFRCLGWYCEMWTCKLWEYCHSSIPTTQGSYVDL